MGNHKSKMKKSKTQRGSNRLNNSDLMSNPDFHAYDSNPNNSAVTTSSYNKQNLFQKSYTYNNTNTTTEIKSINFTPGSWFQVPTIKINIGLGWDFDSSETYDLDASVTGFDECNEPIESIYYGNLDGLSGSVHHFGDNLTGAGERDDEGRSINLNQIPEKVISLAITVNSYKSNSLIKAKQAFIRLFENKSKREIGKFILNKTKDCIVLLLGLLERNRQEGG